LTVPSVGRQFPWGRPGTWPGHRQAARRLHDHQATHDKEERNVADPFIGEIRMTSFNFAPRGWALCNGQYLGIGDHPDLYAVIGQTFGGDNAVVFRLPDLQGRTAVHPGSGISYARYGGEATHTLAFEEMPAHAHGCRGYSGKPDSGTPVNNAWATLSANPYSDTSNAMLDEFAVSSTGGGQPHPNLQPYLVVNFIIALVGTPPGN
jgi:microcystin-dependent protein